MFISVNRIVGRNLPLICYHYIDSDANTRVCVQGNSRIINDIDFKGNF